MKTVFGIFPLFLTTLLQPESGLAQVVVSLPDEARGLLEVSIKPSGQELVYDRKDGSQGRFDEYNLVIRNDSENDIVGIVFLTNDSGFVSGMDGSYFYYSSENPDAQPIRPQETRTKAVGVRHDPVRGPQLELIFHAAVFSDGTSAGQREPLATQCIEQNQGTIAHLDTEIQNLEQGDTRRARLEIMREKSVSLVDAIRRESLRLLQPQPDTPR